jgi:predicted nucleic acid-binding protein
MDKYYGKKVMIDSNIFLEVLLEQGGTDKCKEILNGLKESHANLFVTPIIIREIMDKIEEANNPQREPSLRAIKVKLKSDGWGRLLFHFHKLIAGMTVDFPGKDFGSILSECMTYMRVGEKDTIHVASALAGNFDLFLTCNEKLYK